MQRCLGVTRLGLRCNRKAYSTANTHCWQHSNVFPSQIGGGSDHRQLQLEFKTGLDLPTELRQLPKELIDLGLKRIQENKISVDKIISEEDIKVESLKIIPGKIIAVVKKRSGKPFDAEDLEHLIDTININGDDSWREGDISVLDEEDWDDLGIDIYKYMKPKYRNDPNIDMGAIKMIEQTLELTSVNGIPINFDKNDYYTPKRNKDLRDRAQEILDSI